jgi:hypothetical protein
MLLTSPPFPVLFSESIRNSILVRVLYAENLNAIGMKKNIERADHGMKNIPKWNIYKFIGNNSTIYMASVEKVPHFAVINLISCAFSQSSLEIDLFCEYVVGNR